MKRIIWTIAAASILSGCGFIDRIFSGVTGAPTQTCVQGVTYLQFTTGSALLVDKAGKPVECK